ncbi:MAG TPA: triose-phosphate isomerase [Dehalococcoidales bacterium]
MRIPFVAGNWKMNTTLNEGIKLVAEMRPGIESTQNIEVALCPPFISLTVIHNLLSGSKIKLGAQNLFYEEKGAFTGEISPMMLAGLCEYVILGHSERRQYFGETSEIVSRKVNSAIKAGLKPILCIGENLTEFEAGKTEEIVTGQLLKSLAGVDPSPGLVIAYEPVWAIGTGKAATGERANEVISLIRQTITGLYDKNFAYGLRILYGGSVTGDNIAEFVGQAEIDGALVGGASLKTDQFISIVRKTAQLKNQ